MRATTATGAVRGRSFRLVRACSHLTPRQPAPCAPAFPGSSAGRCSRDYYGHSVAIGLAPVGDPAVRLRHTYRARRRPPTHPLDHPRWAVLRATEVARSHGSCPGMARRRLQASFRRVRHFHHWGLGFKQSSLGHITRVLRHDAPERLRDGHRFLGMLLSPPLSLPGRPSDPRTSFRVPPDCVGDTTKRLTAHTVRDSLPSHGSCHLDHQYARIHRQCTNRKGH